MNQDLEFFPGGYKMTKPDTKKHKMASCAVQPINRHQMMNPETEKPRMVYCEVKSTEEQNLANASEFVDRVKQTELYNPFIAALKEFHDGKIDAHNSFFKLQNLFAAHQNLLRGLEIFRPESARKIEIPTPPAAEERRGTPDLVTCRNEDVSSIGGFLNAVKERFEDHPETYKEFLDAIVDYNASVKNDGLTLNLCTEIVNLLFGHANLIHRFQAFFSDCEEKLQRRVKRDCSFAIDDRMGEIEVVLSRLRTSIECAEYAQKLASPELLSQFVAEDFVGIKLMGIKKLFGEYSDEVIEFLKKEPKKALPAILEALKEKERAVSLVRSNALQFYKQFRVLDSKRGVKRKSRGSRFD